MTNTSLLNELVAADAQGERAIISLRPGDQFLYRGAFHTIARMQLTVDQQSVIVTTTEPVGEPYLVAGEMFQPLVQFIFHCYLIFPAMLTDEHFSEENPDRAVW